MKKKRSKKKVPLMRYILTYIEKKVDKNASEVARDLGMSRQLYFEYKKRTTLNFNLVNHLSSMYNLSLNKIILLAKNYDK